MLFQAYIAILTAKCVNLPKMAIVASESNVSTCITHASDDDLYIVEDEGQFPKHCIECISDPTANAVCYKRSERLEEQVAHQKAVKESNIISKTDWYEDITLHEEYSAHRNQFGNSLTQL